MVELRVCIGSSCHLKGSYNVICAFNELIEEERLHDKIDFQGTFCLKECSRPGVAVTVNGKSYDLAPEDAEAFFRREVLPLAR